MALRVSLRPRDDSPPTPSTRLMERLAQADRRALGLRFGEPCDPRRLVDLLDVECILESFTDYATFLNIGVDDAAATFAGLDRWSSVTISVAADSLIVLVNPCHAPRRRQFSIAHEFGHLVLGHRPVIVDRCDGPLAHGRYSDADEQAAYGYALALLLPYAPLLQILAAGASDGAIAENYGISLEAVHMRLKLVGLWERRSGR